MAIWMDMTNTLYICKGGATGIIRAELELAKNLRLVNPDIQFCLAKKDRIIKISNEKLNWLWDSDSAINAYNDYFKEKKTPISPNNKQDKRSIPSGLRDAINLSDSRIERIRYARELYINNFSGYRKILCRLLTGIVYKPLKGVSIIRAEIKKSNDISTSIKLPSNIKIISHPFNEGDLIFSCGWFTGNKENLYSQVKDTINNITLVWLIYDLMLAKEDLLHLYDEFTTSSFRDYLFWIANNCDAIIYGGRTAQKDAENFYKKENLPIKLGYSIRFGGNIFKNNNRKTKDKNILKKYGVYSNDYILTVGSIDAKKNYDTIYKSYCILKQQYSYKEIPSLIIVGGKYNLATVELFETDPFTKDKVKILNPNDEELSIIYEHALFTILPTVYEGWSLTLPESLTYGKFCLCSDVEPLKEIAGDLVEYIDPFDPAAWAERIMYYYQNKKLLVSYGEKINLRWKPITWYDCACQLNQQLINISKEIKKNLKQGSIYCDLTLTMALSTAGASVSGILRTQILLTRYLNRQIPNLRFCAFLPSGCIIINKNEIAPLLSNKNIECAFNETRPNLIKLLTFLNSENSKKTQFKQSQWLLVSVLPSFMQEQIMNIKQYYKKHSVNQMCFYNIPINEKDIIFSSGTGFELNVYEKILAAKQKQKFKFIQLIYDFTPILYPQMHRKETIEYYKPFLKYSSLISDVIFYGGETAKKDGIEYEQKHSLPIRPAIAIKFGSNIVKENRNFNDNDILKKFGITQKYLMVVGSIEIRKNHETLYLAYLDMMTHTNELPQLVFCGYPGWKTESFCIKFHRDKRIKNKILMITPNDEELDILYRNCEFTVLASLYEGWSLTLPESLNYGKFCIASNVAPLKEIGGDFIDYVEPYDVKSWSEKMLFYYNNRTALQEKEKNIRENWHSITWEDCAKQVAHELIQYRENF